jgi:hypothetical protein
MHIRWLTIVLDFPAADLAAGKAFWCEVTGSALSAWQGTAGERGTLLPAHGDACLRVQRTGGGQHGCHPDLHVDPRAGSLDEAAAQASLLGARVRRRSGERVVMASPGGLAFCLVPWAHEAAVPAATRLGTGGASRADQLCLDIPPGNFTAECSFWAAMTGWELRPGRRPEFCYLERPAGLPVRLLLQRRDQAGPRDLVSAHADFACTGPRQLAVQHAALGAQALTTFPNWVVMADPAGRRYCLTARDPGTGKLQDRDAP